MSDSERSQLMKLVDAKKELDQRIKIRLNMEAASPPTNDAAEIDFVSRLRPVEPMGRVGEFLWDAATFLLILPKVACLLYRYRAWFKIVVMLCASATVAGVLRLGILTQWTPALWQIPFFIVGVLLWLVALAITVRFSVFALVYGLMFFAKLCTFIADEFEKEPDEQHQLLIIVFGFSLIAFFI